jgi:hypothetical protein
MPAKFSCQDSQRHTGAVEWETVYGAAPYAVEVFQKAAIEMENSGVGQEKSAAWRFFLFFRQNTKLTHKKSELQIVCDEKTRQKPARMRQNRQKSARTPSLRVMRVCPPGQSRPELAS